MMMELYIEYILVAILYVKCLVGFTVNMIIVAANFIKWKSPKSLQTCDKILSSLAISRGLFFFSVIIRNTIFQFFPWLTQETVVMSALYIQTMFMFYSSHWFVTILCVFYCVKIVTYNCKLFVFLKTRISTMVPWLITASLLISMISSLPFAWYGYVLKLQDSVNGSTINMTNYDNKLVIAPNYDKRFLIFVVGSFLPFGIFCIANLLLIQFLLIHTRRMRSIGSHTQSPNLESHFSALKSMSLFLVLQILLFICMNLASSSRFYVFNLSIWIRWIILCSLPLIHSLYIISSSGKLRKMFIAKFLNIIRRS